MKLISLNTWCGRHFEPLARFIKKQSRNTDIFCFQEIYDTTSDIKQYKNIMRANLLEELRNILLGFNYFHFPTFFGFDPTATPIDFDAKYGLAIFIKKELKLNSYNKYFIYGKSLINNVHKNFSNVPIPLQHIQFIINNKTFNVFNFHGTPYPPVKKDTPKRLRQSKRVKEIVDKERGAKILVGDFNLSPDTKSITMFEKEMRNLIKEFNIDTTRSRLCLFHGKRSSQKYADYTFITPDISLKSFAVPKVAISDHLPMILEFE